MENVFEILHKDSILQKDKRGKILKLLEDIWEKELTGNLLINFNKGNLCDNYKFEIFEKLNK